MQFNNAVFPRLPFSSFENGSKSMLKSGILWKIFGYTEYGDCFGLWTQPESNAPWLCTESEFLRNYQIGGIFKFRQLKMQISDWDSF